MNDKTILVVDTQLEGHHVLWLYLVGSALYELNYKVIILANSNVAEVTRRLSLLNQDFCNLISIVPSSYAKRPKLKCYWQEVSSVFDHYKCTEILFNNFDTIASSVFRLAVFGILPPKSLQGRMSAIYHRPRPFDPQQKGFSNIWKRIGSLVLAKHGYLKHLWFLDPKVVESVTSDGVVKCGFIPDPWSVSSNSSQPMEITEVDLQKIYLLQYGVGDKRKGTVLLLEALLMLDENINVHVWLAGKQLDHEVLSLAEQLVSRGKLTLINRYITDDEERWLFENCSWVTLPYLSHYGSSNLLSKAAKFAKPVIASDFHLIGRNVADYNLGLLFIDRDCDSLSSVLKKLPGIETRSFLNHLNDFASKYSLINFKKSLANNFPRCE